MFTVILIFDTCLQKSQVYNVLHNFTTDVMRCSDTPIARFICGIEYDLWANPYKAKLLVGVPSMTHSTVIIHTIWI